MEEKASIRKSLDFKNEYHENHNLLEPTEDNDDFASEKEESKDFEDEDITHLESHLNDSIGRIINKIRKIKRSSNKKRTTMSVHL